MRMPWWLPFGRVPELSANDLAQRLVVESNPQVVDVRTHSEFAAGCISGAVSAPVQSFAQTYHTLDLDRARPVYVICRTAHRSVPAVRLLRSQGFDAYQLASGMNAWWRASLPTVKPQQ